MIDGNTTLTGLIGLPTGHSLSPCIHNAAFEELDINWIYVPLPVKMQDVPLALKSLGCMGFRGINVTIPHKQTVFPCIDYLDDTAKKLSAVNTVVFDANENEYGYQFLHGYNTDVTGFTTDLFSLGFLADSHPVALLAGAGGAARAVLLGLIESGIKKIIILNRSMDRARALVRDLEAICSTLPEIVIKSYSPDILVDVAGEANLLINSTPLGMWPKVNESIWPDNIDYPSHLMLYDLVYNPYQTKLVHQAMKSKAIANGGLGMLIQQAGLAFKLWTGLDAPLATMRIAALKEIHKLD